ncbi:MAG: ankyrin repeat domain-containing protein [Bacteroidota bacterium]
MDSLIKINNTLEEKKNSDVLLEAIKSSNTIEVVDLLKRNFNPNVRDGQSGLSALMLAAGLGNPEMVKELIGAGANIFDTDSKAGSTALHKACQAGSLDVVRLLADAGAFIDAVATSTGHTPLIEALWFKWPDIVEYLLEKGASLNVKTHYGFSLLDHFQYALKVNVHGKDKLIKADELLQKRQKDDDDRIHDQKLMAAVFQNDLETVQRLIKGGVNVDERYPSLGGFNDFHTPLLVACRQGYMAIAAELINAGADINAIEPTFGAVPLHKATYNGFADITRLLAEQPGINLDFQGMTNGYTPLHDALWHGFSDCAEILVNAGARLDLKGHDGKLPVDIANDIFGSEHPLVRLIKSKT